MKGSCLCGAVVFEVTGTPREVIACHCRQCRKLSGHGSASFATLEADLAWQSRACLAEYCGSPWWILADPPWPIAAVGGGGHIINAHKPL